MSETLYAVDIKLSDSTGIGSPHTTKESTALSSLSESFSRIERGLASGRIGGAAGGVGGVFGALSGAAEIATPIALGLLGAIGTAMASAKIRESPEWQALGTDVADWLKTLPQFIKDDIGATFDVVDSFPGVSIFKGWLDNIKKQMGVGAQDAFGKSGDSLTDKFLKTLPGGGFIDWLKKLIHDHLPGNQTSTGPNASFQSPATTGMFGDNFKNKEIAKQIAEIEKDGITTKEESLRLTTLEDELNQNNTDLLEIQNKYHVETGVLRQQNEKLMTRAMDLQKNMNSLGQQNVSIINSEAQALTTLARAQERLNKAKEKGSKGKSQDYNVTTNNGDSMGVYNGQTYSQSEAQAFGLVSSSQGVFIGVRTVM